MDGATPDDVADPAGTGAGPEPAPPEARPDWHAAPLRAAPATDAPLTVTLSTPPSPRLTASFGSGPSSAGRWLAIAFLVVIVLATLVMFRDVIVQALPGLAPIYAAMGLLVHPVVVPHG